VLCLEWEDGVLVVDGRIRFWGGGDGGFWVRGSVSRMENSPEGGGAMKRGMVDGLGGMRGFDCWAWMGEAS